MATVTSPIITDDTGQDINTTLQSLVEAISPSVSVISGAYSATTVSNARYTKIVKLGKWVLITVNFELNASASGSVLISGLPLVNEITGDSGRLLYFGSMAGADGKAIKLMVANDGSEAKLYLDSACTAQRYDGLIMYYCG